MRGNPLRELLLFCLAWGLLLVPLRGITRQFAAGAGRMQVLDEPDAQATAWLRVQFSESPRQFTLQSGGGQVLWVEGDPDPDMEQPVAWTQVEAAAEVRYELIWPDAGRRVMEVEVALPVGGTLRGTVWLHGAHETGSLLLQ